MQGKMKPGLALGTSMVLGLVHFRFEGSFRVEGQFRFVEGKV